MFVLDFLAVVRRDRVVAVALRGVGEATGSFLVFTLSLILEGVEYRYNDGGGGGGSGECKLISSIASAFSICLALDKLFLL